LEGFLFNNNYIFFSTLGCRPREILTGLKEKDPESAIISKDIYNLKSEIRKEKLQGRSPMEALLEELVKSESTYDYKTDHEGHITHLFSASKEQIRMAQMFNTVFLLDCTYKTNQYRLPLLNFVLVTNLNSSFICAIAFVNEEKYEDYLWAFSCFSKIFIQQEQPKVLIFVSSLLILLILLCIYRNLP